VSNSQRVPLKKGYGYGKEKVHSKRKRGLKPGLDPQPEEKISDRIRFGTKEWLEG